MITIFFFFFVHDYRVPGNESLNLAIQNVKAHYVVVGVMEEFVDFVTALEYLLPNYFRGAADYFRDKGIVNRFKFNGNDMIEN